ncbi:MAG: hypothetical protein OXG60_07855 [Chloroflexi bacterium]|nr:hypothetical protein [Chloroflexota bacterium]
MSTPNKYGGASGFAEGNTYYRRVNGAGIGVQSILDQRPIDAVDVWGPGAESGGQICFQGSGRLVFLDARTSPRAQSTLTTIMLGEKTCAQINGPGTVVFLPPEG